MGALQNILGVVFGMTLASVLQETMVVNQFLEEPKLDYSSSSQPSRKLQERLENCARQLDETTRIAEQRTQEMTKTISNSSSIETAAICAIQKGGLYYVDEWVDYHLALGFQTVYLYDNSDNFELKEWAESRNPKQVIVHHFPGDKRQVPAYHDCLEKQKFTKQEQQEQRRMLRSKPVVSKQKRFKNDWLAFLDIDEFIVLKEDRHSNIADMMKDTVPSDKAGLALSRVSFYFNENQTSYEPVPVTKRFQMRSEEVKPLVKMIAKTSQILKPDVHTVSYRGNKRLSVDTQGHQVNVGTSAHKSLDIAVVHHYETKSIEEFRAKCERGDAVYGKYQKGDEIRGNQISCKSEEELKNHFRGEVNRVGETFDDSA